MNQPVSNTDYQADFCLPEQGSYLLNHSVGRPLKSAEQHFKQAYFTPWQQGSTEPWQDWLTHISAFQAALGQLFNHAAANFCPQSNLSSGLVKLVMSHARLQQPKARILMSEQDFPSMGFALRQALPECDIVFIPAGLDITLLATWQEYLNESLDLVFISQVYSNTGQQAPVHQVVQHAKALGVLSMVDVAQSAGIIDLDLTDTEPDFMLGSSVKWLCSGPGAAYLWVHPNQLTQCQPKDVGWFSHQNPFEFNIHDFRYHDTALRFWGGTPTIAPFILAAHSIDYFNQLPKGLVRQHNMLLLKQIQQAFPAECVSPLDEQRCSGTAILQFSEQQDLVLKALKAANIGVDARQCGLRISPHIYNDNKDIAKLVTSIKALRLS